MFSRVAIIRVSFCILVVIVLLANQSSQSWSVIADSWPAERCSEYAAYAPKWISYDVLTTKHFETYHKLQQSCVIPSSELFHMPLSWLCCKSSTYYFAPSSQSGRKRIIVALLLLMSGIKPNPGPAVHTS